MSSRALGCLSVSESFTEFRGCLLRENIIPPELPYNECEDKKLTPLEDPETGKVNCTFVPIEDYQCPSGQKAIKLNGRFACFDPDVHIEGGEELPPTTKSN